MRAVAPTRSGPHPDRTDLPRWLLSALVVATATAGGLAGWTVGRVQTDTPVLGVAFGVAAPTVGLLVLRALSLRLVARLVLLLSAVPMVRFGVLGGSLLAGSQSMLLWLVAGVAVLVLTDRVGTAAEAPLGPVPPASVTPPSSAVRATAAPRPVIAPAATARVVAVVALLVLVGALVLTPLVQPLMPQGVRTGEGPRGDAIEGAGASLRSADTLDMTTRPDLTDEVLFTVTADRASFWRGETFDRWDGRRWTRSDPRQDLVPPSGLVPIGADDLGARGTEVLTQRVRIAADYADVLFAAPSAVAVDAGRPLARRADGTLGTLGGAMGRGATYEVTSRHPVLTEARLVAVDAAPTPPEILARYAAPPVATDRVLDAAREVTQGADTRYAKVRAIEAWMGARAEYALDAPLSPEGVDVVDHFLFESREGWCEQIASSLVVLARASGIPARLVTGFVPGERDRVTGDFLVRGVDAHAWAEVWFPEVGWVPFDPTADVPLAPQVDDRSTLGAWLIDHSVVLLLGAAVVALVGWPLLRLLRLLRRRAAARRSRPVTWAARADAALSALGERVDRPRRIDESALSHATVLVDRYGDRRLHEVGRALDDALYAPEGPDRHRRDAVDSVLGELAQRPVPDPPAGVATPAGPAPGAGAPSPQ